MEKATEIVETVADVAKTFSAKEQGTRRQQIDMLADTTLSKNIRPIIAIWVMVLLTTYIIFEAAGKSFSDKIGETVFWLVIIVFGFYFPGRTAEKWISQRQTKK
ncbi:MAG: hypothetical protein A2W90_02630 [Bacteroidetes bacterium GWF2_42_66]|nr:MAG: hypothetical protein A2W92_19670 [Bacteroidetes bacterium GWA2_42_15]OFY01247.1 MAG: hypothetical protein A2W89_16115 [Bacteroidetes bacterium GWE2_42_39]OFY42090.1 MAG: hypothetical protein A2W90_02630 [Bacteroidetes bacterium GWF2_42_66]HBL77707.1 hypothetical protein [Prolixibacteraceae bacterium]HCB62836.1 hypothetical protein [Bacteroidales bacterium]